MSNLQQDYHNEQDRLFNVMKRCLHKVMTYNKNESLKFSFWLSFCRNLYFDPQFIISVAPLDYWQYIIHAQPDLIDTIMQTLPNNVKSGFISECINLADDLVNKYERWCEFYSILFHCPQVSYRLIHKKMGKSPSFQRKVIQYMPIKSKILFDDRDIMDIKYIVQCANIQWSDIINNLDMLEPEHINNFGRYNPNMTMDIYHQNKTLFTIQPDEVCMKNMKYSDFIKYKSVYQLPDRKWYHYESEQDYISHLLVNPDVECEEDIIISYESYMTLPDQAKVKAKWLLSIDDIIEKLDYVPYANEYNVSHKLRQLKASMK